MDDKVKDDIERLTLYALGKYKREGIAPKRWSNPICEYCGKMHNLLAGGPQARRQSLWIPLPVAPRFEDDELWRPAPWRPRGITPSRPWRSLPPKGPTSRTAALRIFPSAGAEWLLLHKVRESVTNAHNLSTFVPFKTRMALLDERRDETQGGLTGRHDGINRSPKTGTLTAFDVFPADADNSESGSFWPLVRYSADPLMEACRQEMLEAYAAASYRSDGQRYSRPTQRRNIKAGPSPTDYLLDGVPYWREPADGVYLTPWHWKPDGHLVEKYLAPTAWREFEYSRFLTRETWPKEFERVLLELSLTGHDPSRAQRKTWGNAFGEITRRPGSVRTYEQGSPLKTWLVDSYDWKGSEAAKVREWQPEPLPETGRPPAVARKRKVVAGQLKVQFVPDWSTLRNTGRREVIGPRAVGSLDQTGNPALWREYRPAPRDWYAMKANEVPKWISPDIKLPPVPGWPPTML